MPVAMSVQRPNMNYKQLKALITKEFNFLKNVFSEVTLPQIKDEDSDDEIVNDNAQNNEVKELPKRARSIAELEEKLEKLKSQKKFNLKTKLVKKSISSKLNKKIKKKERQKNKVKGSTPNDKHDIPVESQEPEEVPEKKPKIEHKPKPVFNTDAKLVFSKFDFSSVGQHDKPRHKKEKDPKKILENLKLQEQKFKELEEKDGGSKVKELKEKMAWKTILQKAEGEKVKDDPLLLKKSIKKIEQKKKGSKKQWDKRIENVQQKKADRQKKRQENISKKKKEKKSKVVKAAQKRGRVVI